MKKTVKDVQIKGKRVLMRVDFNVPLDEKRNITDDSRITAALPTIEYVLQNGGKLILMSHLGRPDGEVMMEYSMAPVAERLSELLKLNVKKLDDCVGEDVEEAVRQMKAGEVVLLENLRFHKGETKNDPVFAKQLASLGDVFVMDAFGTCHRAHASTEGVTKYLPSVAGFLVGKEIEYFEKVTKNPEKPFTLILGGAKVSDKIPVIENMLKRVDFLLIGGAMAYTFLKSRMKGIGNSKVEDKMLPTVNKIFELASVNKVGIFLPKDHVVVKEVKEGTKSKVVTEHIPDGWIGLDIGPETIKSFKSVLEDSKTIVWNGPMGLFEMKPFDEGTNELAKCMAKLKATTVIGGGDTAAAVNELGLGDKMSHVSTGGGASLEYLEGKILPGIAALNDK
ncbi:MAG TPA: phosphoglycerate kinase [Candidatus Omnitrophota bacterium]|nr:phosphoglycerate kinase [Candidatus Omnitrophota bacterium]HPS19575.1 phosphoglycerate kinase [Candidatus Omnitrophota bacterium]